MKQLLLAPLMILILLTPGRADEPTPLKAGIIGLDTSHVVAFTQLLNGPKATGPLGGVRVVAAFPGGSQDISSSRDRLKGFTEKLRDEFKVEIVDSIETLIKKVDVILLESVDGRPHLSQVRPVFASRKPVFIDKPIAGSLADALEIARLARESGTPCFSSSSLRFTPSIQSALKDPKVGPIHGVTSYGPCSLEEHHPDLYWYGVHGVEILYTLMGTGCDTVARVHTKDTEYVTGTWKDGRIGTFRGLRGGKQDYGALVFGAKGIISAQGYGGYEPLVVEIVKFFKTGKAPVSLDETVEMFAFMEAADESKRRGGAPVKVADVIAKAKTQNSKR